MGARLTTHVLDTARGCPAAELAITLHALGPDGTRMIGSGTTNADGRTDAPLHGTDLLPSGRFELVFHAGPYLQAHHGGGAVFLEDIPIRFTIDAAAHYHVPLLLSPYGYSTYRGS